MKVFGKCVLTFFFFLTFFGLRAQGLELISQEPDLLKAFINKNDVALKSVQKNSLKNPNTLSAESFKELLKLQLISVKQYGSDKSISSAAAYKLRNESLDFLSKNSAGSVDYFKITKEEAQKIDSKATLPAVNTFFSENELKSIDAIDSKDPGLFKAFNTTIQ